MSILSYNRIESILRNGKLSLLGGPFLEAVRDNLNNCDLTTFETVTQYIGGVHLALRTTFLIDKLVVSLQVFAQLFLRQKMFVLNVVILEELG